MNGLFGVPSMDHAINAIEMDVGSDMRVLDMHGLVYIMVDQV